MAVARLQTIKPDPSGASSFAEQHCQGHTMPDIDMVIGDVSHDLPVGRDQGPRCAQEQRIPLQIFDLERRSVQPLLIFQSPS